MQPNNILAEGGVMQEGGTVDPVSGNAVPPGAMKEVGAWDNPTRKKAMIENFIKYDRANGAR